MLSATAGYVDSILSSAAACATLIGFVESSHRQPTWPGPGSTWSASSAAAATGEGGGRPIRSDTISIPDHVLIPTLHAAKPSCCTSRTDRLYELGKIEPR